MPELGPQLEHEGSRVELGPGALERFEDRLQRKQRIRKVGVYVVVLSVCVVGVAAGVWALSGRTVTGPATSPSPAPVRTSAVLAPGMYWTQPLTRHQLVATLGAHGFATPRDAQHFFKDLGSFSHTVRFGIQVQTNGVWNQFEQRDKGSSEVGWAGAYRATGPHQMTVFGYGCAIAYDISRRAGQVVIRVLNQQGPSYKGICGHRDLVAQTVIYDTAAFLLHS
jgi:hypothetical protein